MTTIDYASQIWRNVSDFYKSEVQASISNFQFSGRGQSKQPVITFPGALKLIMFLPGEVAKKHRSAMVTILTRYFAGDPSLIKDIAANAMSDSPICQLARGPGGLSLLEDAHKRKREDLEDLRIEAELRCSIMEKSLDQYVSIMETYKTLCLDQDIDERAKSTFKEIFFSTVLPKDVSVNEEQIRYNILKQDNKRMADELKAKTEALDASNAKLKEIELNEAIEIQKKNGFCVSDIVSEKELSVKETFCKSVILRFKQLYPERQTFKRHNVVFFFANDRTTVEALVQEEYNTVKKQ